MSILIEDMAQKQDRSRLYAGLIVLLALLLRLYHLGSESLWIDEGFSLRDIRGIQFLDETRPLYFAIMSGFTKIIHSRSEFVLRLPSAIFGTLGVWLLYVVGRRLLGTRPALLASFFMAISVLHINHSREIRMYSLSVLMILLATYFMIRWLGEGKKLFLAGYVVSAAASLLTFPLNAFILVAHGVYVVLHKGTYRARGHILIVSLFCVAGLWMPWMLNNLHATSEFSKGYTTIVEKPTAGNFLPFIGKFFLWKWSDPGRKMVMLATMFSALMALLAVLGMKDLRRRPGLSLALTWFAVPMMAVIALSHGVMNLWMPHYEIAVTPALFLLAANGVCRIKSKTLATGLIAVIVVTVFGRLHLYYSKHIHPEWKAAVTYVEEREQPGDVIGIYYGGNQYVFHYYYKGRSKWSEVGEDKIDSSHFNGWDSRRVRSLIDSFPLSGRRCWLILSNHDYAGGSVIVRYVQQNYRILDHEYYSQIETLLFDAKGKPVPHARFPARSQQARTAEEIRNEGSL